MINRTPRSIKTNKSSLAKSTSITNVDIVPNAPPTHRIEKREFAKFVSSIPAMTQIKQNILDKNTSTNRYQSCSMHPHKELKTQGRELFNKDAAPTSGRTNKTICQICFSITTREQNKKDRQLFWSLPRDQKS